jgi:hypothetical protein
MDEWMDGWYWHKKNSFSLEGLHKTNQWRKNPVQFFIFFKRAGMGNPFTRSTRHLKAREEHVATEHNNQDTTNIRTKGVSHHTWPYHLHKNITIRTPLIYKQRVFHTTRGLTIYIKTYLKAKAELWKIKYLSMQKNNNLQKKKTL